ncbi:MAG: BamA/TamA family outer membrane protein [Candidatus Eisenbacteria bacterium]|uniref:BamA/TamA family outer membrane protein n=1 Tax=Eiseniibacteriota bacterium TaxID=2212470 RepID=A0A956RMV7_UNCEI|nr:BamA/TamA family outer membrane protein [Candidatus Eisenbacteria bacterium]
MALRNRLTFLFAWTLVLVGVGASSSFAAPVPPSHISDVFHGARFHADSESSDGATTAEPDRLRLFPPRLYYGGVFYLPKITYSKDRGVGGGAYIYYPFRLSGTSASIPASALRAHGRITLKGQALADFSSDFYFGNAPWRVGFKVAYSDLAERFYGIGPDTPAENKEVYRPQRLRTYLEVARPFVQHLSLGLRLEYENVLLRDLDPKGQLVRKEIKGTNRQTVGALGILASWDGRDDASFPRRGIYIEGFYLPFNETLRGDFDFENHNLDVRVYFPMPGGNALANQFFYYAVRGEPPFWRYASLGGREHTRGYRKDRYLDRVLVAFQSELRFHLVSRLSGAAFAGLGDVAPSLSHLELEHMKPSVGGGLRVHLGSKDRGATGRFDVALGGTSPQLYLAFGEAF